MSNLIEFYVIHFIDGKLWVENFIIFLFLTSHFWFPYVWCYERDSGMNPVGNIAATDVWACIYQWWAQVKSFCISRWICFVTFEDTQASQTIDKKKKKNPGWLGKSFLPLCYLPNVF